MCTVSFYTLYTRLAYISSQSPPSCVVYWHQRSGGIQVVWGSISRKTAGKEELMRRRAVSGDEKHKPSDVEELGGKGRANLLMSFHFPALPDRAACPKYCMV